MPERLDEIREIFRDHPVVEVSDEQLEQGQVDVEGLKKFLVEDRQFSQKDLTMQWIYSRMQG